MAQEWLNTNDENMAIISSNLRAQKLNFLYLIGSDITRTENGQNNQTVLQCYK